jgi:SlyX protein
MPRLTRRRNPPRPLNDYPEEIRRLEEKIAYLERHVTEQDKVMLEMADGLARLKKEMKALREREAGGAAGGSADGGEVPDERPPHY